MVFPVLNSSVVSLITKKILASAVLILSITADALPRK